VSHKRSNASSDGKSSGFWKRNGLESGRPKRWRTAQGFLAYWNHFEESAFITSTAALIGLFFAQFQARHSGVTLDKSSLGIMRLITCT
jgi:hypothetical protein